MHFLTSAYKVIWSFGKGSEIFRENSHLFDFHLKAYYVHAYLHENYSPEMCLVLVEFGVKNIKIFVFATQHLLYS